MSDITKCENCGYENKFNAEVGDHCDNCALIVKKDKNYECSNCEDGHNLAEECTCWDCGRDGSLIVEKDKHYSFIENFVNDYCKDEKDRKEFFDHLGELVDCEIKIEECCNQ